MCGMVMTERGQVLNRTSIFPLSVEDLNNPAIEDRKATFTGILEAKLKDKEQAIHGAKTPQQMKRLGQKWRSEETPEHVPHEEWKASELGSVASEGDKPTLPDLAEADDVDLNNYIAAKVMLPKDGHTFASGKVVQRARNPDGELVGKSSGNPLLDTSVYEVEFEDGSVERYRSESVV